MVVSCAKDVSKAFVTDNCAKEDVAEYCLNAVDVVALLDLGIAAGTRDGSCCETVKIDSERLEMSFGSSWEEEARYKALVAKIGSLVLSGSGSTFSEELVLLHEIVVDRESEVATGNLEVVSCGRNTDSWRDFLALW